MAKKAKKRVVKKAAKKRGKRREVILPSKLSSLIGVALKDIRRAEALPTKFVVDMDTWFQRETVECRTSQDVLIESHEVCTLCAAGSVMAFSLGALNTKHSDLSTSAYPKNEAQLNAINELRSGGVGDAARQLWPGDFDDYNNHIPDAKEVRAAKFDTIIPPYDREDPEPFHKAMTRLQANLQKAGL